MFMNLQMKSLNVYQKNSIILGGYFKETETTFIEFYSLPLIAMLSTLGNVFLCPWSMALIMCLINLQFANIGFSGSPAKYCCIVVGSGCCWWCACVCVCVCASWGKEEGDWSCDLA